MYIKEVLREWEDHQYAVFGNNAFNNNMYLFKKYLS